MISVLLIEDDAEIRSALARALGARDFDVVEAANGLNGLQKLIDQSPEIVVLDLGLPDIDGLEVLQRVRAFSTMPVIVVTAHHQQAEKIRALDAGADDYVTKPFDTEELLARIRATLRRVPQTNPTPTLVRIDGVEIDLARRRVTLDGNAVHLTRTELALLELLVSHPGKLLTQEFLLREVWGQGYGSESNYLRVYVGQLRKKLGDAAAHPRLILTEPGIGYRWIADEEPPA